MGFEQQLVREFFELHGFSVRQTPNTAPRSLVDIEVFNPAPDPGQSVDFMVFPNQLAGIRQARILARGWQAHQKYSLAQLSKSESILHFIESNLSKNPSPVFTEASQDSLNLLLLPSLPTREPARSRATDSLRREGVQGVLSFLSILRALVSRADRFPSAAASDTLRLIRVLKSFDLLKNQQLEIDYENTANQ